MNKFDQVKAALEANSDDPDVVTTLQEFAEAFLPILMDSVDPERAGARVGWRLNQATVAWAAPLPEPEPAPEPLVVTDDDAALAAELDAMGEVGNEFGAPGADGDDEGEDSEDLATGEP
jgi:hypothetical protein